MKKIVSISMGLLAILAISCSKKDSPVSTPAETAKQNLKEVSITVGAPEDIETKVAYAYDETEKKLKLTWEQGDKIVLQQGDQAYPFTATTISENGKMATFTGTAAGKGSYDVFYAGKGTEAMTLSEVEAMDYSVQTQSANDNTSHLKFAARLNNVTFTPGEDIYFTSEWAEEKGGTYQQSGAIRICLQNPGTVTGVNCVKLIAPSEIFYKDNRLSEKTNVLTVNFGTSALQTSDDHIVAYAMLPWSDITLPEGQYEVRFEASDFDIYKKTFSVASGVTFISTAVNSITLNKTGLDLQPFYGGTGSEEDPYLIANVRHFKNISTLAANDGSYLEANYRQVEDIYFNGDITDSMIGSSEHPFSGTYVGYKDGVENKTALKLLKITAADNAPVGIFRNVTGTIKHISVAASEVSGGDVVGALVGTLNGGTVSNCVHSGNTVTGSSKVGGLVGEAKEQAKITNCETQTGDTVNPGNSTDYVGGIVGYVTSAEVTNCVNKAKVTGDTNIGGIAGCADGASIVACTNTSMVQSSKTSGNTYIGGIVGNANQTNPVMIESCVNEGTVKGAVFLGGIVGDLNGSADKCLNKAAVTGSSSNVGGIAGSLRGNSIVRRCYSSKEKEIKGTNRVGGIVGVVNSGDNEANTTWIVNCFSNSNVTGTDNTANYGVGGLVGILNKGILANGATGDITVKCSASCTNKSNAKVYVGGIVGYLAADGTIQNVYSPLYAKDIKIGSIHGRSGSGKIGQIVGYTAGTLIGYYFGGCATATTGWQYWGTTSNSTVTAQFAITTDNNVSFDWTKPIQKDFVVDEWGISLTAGNYYMSDLMNVAINQDPLASEYTKADGEVLTWSPIDGTNTTDTHPIPDALIALGENYYKN